MGRTNIEWTPTTENINALPGPIRKYIHDVETRCDPTGLVQENTVLKDTVAALEKRVGELEGMITAATTGAGIGAILGQVQGSLVSADKAQILSERFRVRVKPGDHIEKTKYVCRWHVDCGQSLLRLSRPGTDTVALYICPNHGPLYGWLPNGKK
jgi:hypothetical protein